MLHRPGFRCKHAGAHGQAPGAQVPADLAQGIQVPAGQAPGATMQVPAGQAPGANLQVPTTGQAPGVQVPAGSAADIYVLSVWAPGPCKPPPVRYTTQPMGSGHPSKASHSQCRPGPKSGVSSWLKIFLTANLFTRTHSSEGASSFRRSWGKQHIRPRCFTASAEASGDSVIYR